VADIQAPPGREFRRVGKMSRGLANLIYGWGEIPFEAKRQIDDHGSSHATYGVLWGTHKTAIRLAWGLYEVVSAPFPTYKRGFKAPYRNKIEMKPDRGYSAFPPELGFDSSSSTCRFSNF
jgi:putative exosortase-associated protein (TIGR04073 family)